jgi:putative cardiolipin synthase
MRPTASGTTGSSLTGASSGASLHAKAIVIDRQHVLVGSMNLDPRSRRHNTEVGVLLQSADIGESLGAFFDEAVSPAKVFHVRPAAPGQGTLVWISEEAGKETRYSRDPLASAWRRLLVPLLGALTPADLL